MYFVYVLKDEKGKIYKGMTGDLKKRLSEHKAGKTRTTRKMKNIRLIYFERCKSIEEARKKELYFKSAAGRRYLKKVIKDSPARTTDVVQSGG